MKKRFLPLFLGACLASTVPVQAQGGMSPTSTSTIYDFAGYNESKILNLFYDVLKNKGRNYPTLDEFEAIGIQPSDIAFIRSHVAKRNIMDRSDRVNTNTYEKRNLFMNIPGGSGKGLGGYPSSNFANDVYSMWNYTNLFGSWNHGLFQAPGAWVDAAHKNGTTILSGIKFFDMTGNEVMASDKEYTQFITTWDNEKNEFKYVKPLINCLMYFGVDGINYNWEDHSYTQSNITAFHKALYKEAKRIGFNDFHAVIYTSVSTLTSSNSNALFGNQDGRTFHLMLNYQSSNFASNFSESVRAAENALGTAEGLYGSTWIVTMNRDWNRLNGDASYWGGSVTENPQTKKIGVCLWGEHGESRFWSNTSGADAIDAQSNYQRLLEKGFSGGRRNPVSRPPIRITGHDWGGDNALSQFHGLAEFIPERSAIQGNLPFLTHFNLGNGERYNYKGKRTAGTWYNMSNQDVVPTYRWLVYDENSTNVSTALQPEFTHIDSYNGGSCLQLIGKSTAAGADVVLYKTDLNVSSSNPVAKIALKRKSAGESDLYLILKVGSEWKEVAVGATSGKTWEEKTLVLPINTGDRITRIGLRAKNLSESYNVLVGKLELNDDVKATPANVTDLKLEVKEESQKSFSAKMYWNIDKTTGRHSEYGIVYNDEANISHFEILYKNGEDGKVSEVGRTTQWAAYIPNVEYKAEDEQPIIGVRAVSTDLKTYSPVQWIAINRANKNELPVESAGGTDTYGVSRINTSSAGYKAAVEQRYLTSVRTTGAVQNLNFTANAAPADSSQYMNARDHKLIVRQGDEITMTFTAAAKVTVTANTGAGEDDGLRYCFGGGWLDLDGSGTFNHPLPVKRETTELAKNITTTDPLGERIFFVGQVSKGTPAIQAPQGYTFKFKIPEDAHVGQSRLRMVFSDAWFPGAFLPTGFTSKGYTIDFDVEIQGTTTGQRTYVDTQHDQGEAEEPEGLSATTGLDQTIVSDAVSLVSVAEGELSFANVEKAWIYTVDGKLVKFLTNNPTKVSLKDLSSNVYIVKMQYKNVLRTEKVVVK